MNITSTHFISYHDIVVDDTDLIEDAFGYNCNFDDVIALLRKIRFEPDTDLTRSLIDKIRHHDR